jgi:heme/copper-type cytochrome/quinol oxidase subunit 2
LRTIVLITVIVVVVVLSIGSLVALAYSGTFKASTPNGQVVRITIYEEDPPAALAGMNGSYYKSVQTIWPVIQIRQNDTVIITIINQNSSETHGFAIDYYEPGGVATSPGQQNTVTFVANKIGTFRIYCDVLCAIHPLMQNGELIVNS